MKRELLFGFVFLILLQTVSAQNFFLDNFSFYLILVFGIFAFLAYIIVTVLTYKAQKSFGPWLVFSIISFLLLLAQFFLDNILWYRRIIALIMFLLFLAALFKYWDILDMFNY